MNEHFREWCRYRPAFELFRERSFPPRGRDSITIIAIVGPTGSGKSSWALQSFPKAYWVPPWQSNGPIWWDGYCGQSTVVFDEFTGGYPYRPMLRILDRTPCKVFFKGGSTNLDATTFIFTSNRHPGSWYYPGVELARRMREWGHILCLGKPINGRAVLQGHVEPSGGDNNLLDFSALPTIRSGGPPSPEKEDPDTPGPTMVGDGTDASSQGEVEFPPDYQP